MTASSFSSSISSDSKGSIVSATTAQHAVVRGSSSHRRGSVFFRVRFALGGVRGRLAAWRGEHFPRVSPESESDWSVGDFEVLHGQVERQALPPAAPAERHPAPGPELPLGASGSHRVPLSTLLEVEDPHRQSPVSPVPQRPELPLAYMPASPQDVLRNVAHDVMDMLGRDVSNRDAFNKLQGHMAELQKRYREVENLERRSASNVAEMEMEASLLAAAARRGESPEELAERAERVKADMRARALRASDPAPTAQFQVITDDMPDPRVAARPVEVNAGDAELVVSPLHAEDTGTLPAVPAVPAPRSGEAPLPHRGFVGGDDVEPPFEPVDEPDTAWVDDETDESVAALDAAAGEGAKAGASK